MSFDASFERLWHSHDFELPEEPPNLCVYAQKFQEWTQDLCIKVAQIPSIVSVNQFKVLLIDKYFEWRSFSPKRHRNYTGTAQGSHTCIFHVFETAYNRLKVVELSLTPPMLFLPPPPVPPPPPAPPVQISGIFLGEEG